MEILLLEAETAKLRQQLSQNREENLRLETENSQLRSQLRDDRQMQSINDRKQFQVQQKLEQELDECRSKLQRISSEYEAANAAKMKERELEFLQRERHLCDQLQRTTEELHELKSFIELRQHMADQMTKIRQQLIDDEHRHEEQIDLI